METPKHTDTKPTKEFIEGFKEGQKLRRIYDIEEQKKESKPKKVINKHN